VLYKTPYLDKYAFSIMVMHHATIRGAAL